VGFVGVAEPLAGIGLIEPALTRVLPYLRRARSLPAWRLAWPSDGGRSRRSEPAPLATGPKGCIDNWGGR
jgi:hypothetical protein